MPDEVAEHLADLPARQVSAYVTEALRRRRICDEMRATLLAAGHRDYPYDPSGAARRLPAGRVPAAVRDAAIARIAAPTPVDDTCDDFVGITSGEAEAGPGGDGLTDPSAMW